MVGSHEPDHQQHQVGEQERLEDDAGNPSRTLAQGLREIILQHDQALVEIVDATDQIVPFARA